MFSALARRTHDNYYKKGARILQERMGRGAARDERRAQAEAVGSTPSVPTSYWPGYSDTQSSTFGFNPNEAMMSGDEFFATSVQIPPSLVRFILLYLDFSYRWVLNTTSGY